MKWKSSKIFQLSEKDAGQMLHLAISWVSLLQKAVKELHFFNQWESASVMAKFEKILMPELSLYFPWVAFLQLQLDFIFRIYISSRKQNNNKKEEKKKKCVEMHF